MGTRHVCHVHLLEHWWTLTVRANMQQIQVYVHHEKTKMGQIRPVRVLHIAFLAKLQTFRFSIRFVKMFGNVEMW